MKKIIEVIAHQQNNFTKTEQKIANYIINNPLESSVSSVGDMAEILGISKTSLVRFAHRLGFDGYYDFRKQLQEDELKPTSPVERFKNSIIQKSIGSAEELMKVEIENLQESLENLNGDELSKAVEQMISAKHVYTIGGEAASFAAEIMTFRMKQLGLNFMYLDATRTSIIEKLIYSTSEDFLFVFDLPEYSAALVDVAKYAKSKQMTIALLTDYVTCPIVKYADMVFYCDAQTDIFKNSLIAPIFIVNVMVSLAIYSDNQRMIDLLQRKEELYKTLEREKIHEDC